MPAPISCPPSAASRLSPRCSMPSAESLTDLGVIEAADGIRRGACSAVALVAACLARVRALEPELQAWAHVGGDGALAAAGGGDAQAAAFAHTRPSRDCGAVSRLRAAGAIVLGKTHTTQFAYRDPAPTRNPWNHPHTPAAP